MLRLLVLVAAFGLFASAKPVPAQDNNQASRSTTFLFAGDSYVSVAEFNGSAIQLDSRIERGDRLMKPTWIVPSKNGYLVSDASQGGLLDFRYDKESKELTGSGGFRGSPISIGVSHMAYNKAATRLVAATGWGVDIWDSSAPDGNMELVTSEPTGNNSMDDSFTTHVVADPSGKIFVVSDRRANSLMILSVLDDNDIKGIGTIDIEESCGPRRGAFYAADGQNPTRYFVLCQLTRELLSFEVDLSAGTFKLLQKLQTSVETTGDKRSVADLKLQTNSDRSADIYITNTFVSMDGDADTISHFRLPAPEDNDSTIPGDLTDITADRIVSSQGVNPNSISLDSEGEFLIVGNQLAGPAAIAFLKRDKDTGALGDKAEATLNFEKYTGGTKGFGPSFVTSLV